MRAPESDDEDVSVPEDDEAQALIREVLDAWDHRAKGVEELLDMACSQLADAANHRIRQLLTQVSTELELASERTPEGKRVVLEPERLRRVQEAIGEASRVLVTHLDRNQVAKQLIQLNRRAVDLSALFSKALRHEGVPLEEPGIRLDVDPVQASADPEKLRTVVGVLAGRFWTAADPDETLVVTVEDEDEDRLRGFVGLDPCSLDRNDLIDRLDRHLDIGSLEPSVPYARAVLERHGGNLFVDTRGEAGLGYGFTLPVEAVEG